MLCNITDPNSRCAQGCIAKTDVKKRSASGSGSKSYIMTQGPMIFGDDHSDDAEAGITFFVLLVPKFQLFSNIPVINLGPDVDALFWSCQ